MARSFDEHFALPEHVRMTYARCMDLYDETYLVEVGRLWYCPSCAEGVQEEARHG